MIEDAALLRRFAEEKSEEAFAELVRRHLDLVYSTALRQLAGDAHLAQDVTQTVFTALARKASTLTDRATIAGWLYLGAQHAAAQVVRGEQRRRTREQEAQTMHDQLTPDDPPADWDRVRPVIDEAMCELNEADREAVLLRYFARRPFAEIGATLCVSEDAARMRVERALEKLRGGLARRGVKSTGAALAVALANQAVAAAPAGLGATITGAALAGSAAAAGLFMSTTTIVVGVFALVAGGAALHQMNQHQQARAELAALGQAHETLRAQVQAAGERAEKSAQQVSALQRELESARVFKATTKSPVTAAAKPVAGGAGSLTLSANAGGGALTFVAGPTDPVEARRQARAREAVTADASYTALYRKLGWTPEQQEQFRELMFARKEATERLFGAAVRAAVEKNPQLDRAGKFEIFEAVQAQNMRDEQAEVHRVFGPAAGQAMEHYQATLPMRQAAGQLATALFYTEAPLAPAQAEALIEIMAGSAPAGSGRIEIATVNVDQAVTQGQGLLSASQLVEFRRVLLQTQEQANADRARNAAPMPSKPTGG